MNYTESDAFVLHAPTGNRMHQDSEPVTTAVTAKDMNMVVWSMMEVLKEAGVLGVTFNEDDPNSYRAFLDALKGMHASTTDASVGAGAMGFNPTLQYVRGSFGWSEASRRQWNCSDYPWLAKFDGTTDDTAAILACYTAVYNAGGGTVVLPAGTSLVSTIAFTLVASRTVNIRGAGTKATVLQQVPSATAPVLDITGGPAVLDLFATFADFTIIGSGNSQHGIRATRFATSTLVNMGLLNCDIGFLGQGCLVVSHINPYYQFNRIGHCSRRSGAIFSNLVIFEGGKIGGGSQFGMDVGDASGVQVYGTDISGSGTAGNTGTGGVILRSTCDDEVGYATFLMVGGWLEGNKGRQFQAEACGGLSVTLMGVNVASSEGGRAIDVSAGIKSLNLIDIVAASPGDVAACGATPTTVMGGTISEVTGSAVCRINAADSTGTRTFEVNVARIGAGGLKMDSAAYISDNGSSFTQGSLITQFRDNAGAGGAIHMYMANGNGGNAAATVLKLTANSSTSRSINVGGTVNTAGADYAEYEIKRADCGVIEKGDIVGFDAGGLLTDRFDLAVAFGIKSTAPSFVGGDTWFGEQPPESPIPPVPPQRPIKPGNKASDEDKAAYAALVETFNEAVQAYRAAMEEFESAQAAYAAEVAAFEDRLEVARQRVDRIAYSGKVPVNLTNAAPGDWIVPVRRSDGGIGAVVGTEAGAVGRVRSILPDGRVQVVVKAI